MEMAWRELSGGAEANGSRPVRMLRSCLNGRQDELSPLGCLPERTQGGPQVHLFSAYVTKSGRNDNLGTPMASSDLVVELEAPIAVLTLNRPRRRNALSMELMRKLTGELRSIASSGDIKVVIVAAQGPVFSSGHDLTEMIGKDVNAYREMFGACTDLMTTVQSIPQPVIAQVEGVATAAGCQLVASCDLAVASEASTFATPGVKIGLFCSTPMVPLTRAIGRKRALEMLLTGTPISAQTALEWGLLNRVVPCDEVAAATRELACCIGGAGAVVLALGKEAFYSQIDLDQPKAYAYTKEVMTMNALADDGQEGMSAFLEKRTPHWTHREP